MSGTETGFEIISIGQIAIVVHDLPKAVEFYRDKLGLRFLYEFPGLAFFDCGGVRIMLSFPENAEFDHPASIIYYKVADIHAAWRVLESRGVKLEHPTSLQGCRITICGYAPSATLRTIL